jgi:phosphoribosylformylglycinamidine (FGAM) synthase-like enzyme
MNRIEKALMHALFEHLHHNIDRAIDFNAIEQLNQEVSQLWPGSLLIGPGDDAAVFKLPGTEIYLVAKMESHCSPCVPRPYNAAHTCVDGNLRDIVAMGGRPLALLNFVGTRPLDEKVLVGPCGFKGVCECGNCIEMSSKERLDLIMAGMRDACRTMGVFIVGGGFSTSFSDIVPAVVGAAIGRLVTGEPLTKPAKQSGDKIILIGETDNDGNDTLFRAGLVPEMRPAVPVLEKERVAMEVTLAVLQTNKCHACSDLGAAGIGAAVCESARYGGFGALTDLAKVPIKIDCITPEEILICETQGRYAVQVGKNDLDEILSIARREGARAEVIGEITDDDKQIFKYAGETIATIPNQPSQEMLKELKGDD